MIDWKRYIRPDLIFSVLGHVGVLLLGLLVFGASAIRPPPPDAMTVEIVPASELPQTESDNVEGTPLESTSTGSEVVSNSDKGSASTERPQPKTALPSLQQAQTRSNEQRTASLAATQPPTAPEEPQPETQPDAAEPLLSPPAPKLDPQARPEEAAPKSNVAELFAMPLALPGGKLGGGFDAPSANPAMLAHDDTAAFRAHVSACSHLPPGMVDREIAIVLRISFKRDGTLASQPELLRSSLSPDVLPLLQTAVDALKRCQPFTELPPDKYNKWKTMDLIVTPLALSGG
jgi:hypothetical protein